MTRFVFLMLAAVFTVTVIAGADRPYPTSRPPKTAFSPEEAVEDEGSPKAGKGRREQWRKNEVSMDEAKEISKRQREKVEQAPTPVPPVTERRPPSSVPAKPGEVSDREEDQWRKNPVDKRWHAWRHFAPKRQLLLWRGLNAAEREDYWARMNVHEKSTLWPEMDESEKEAYWNLMTRSDRPALCETLPPKEKELWLSRLSAADRLSAPADHEDKFRPAQPEPGYTPKSNFIEVE